MRTGKQNLRCVEETMRNSMGLAIDRKRSNLTRETSHLGKVF